MKEGAAEGQSTLTDSRTSSSEPSPIQTSRRVVSVDLERPALPLEINPSSPGESLIGAVAAQKGAIDGLLDTHGALLFRGFAADETDLPEIAKTVAGGVLPYRDGATPRSALGRGIYTSTDFPAEWPIELHCEACYAQRWPGKLFFFCQTAAAEGGGTPLADTRAVLERIGEDTVARFAKLGLTYVRNFDERIGKDWRDTFGVGSKSQFEDLARRESIEFEWLPNGTLRTLQTRPAIAIHPRTGERCWFNQATAFHVSTLGPEMRRLLTADGEDYAPKTVFFGDGTPIDDHTLAEIRAAFQQVQRVVRWREGDLLIIDNMLVAHGREPFEGQRAVRVAMGAACDWEAFV